MIFKPLILIWTNLTTSHKSFISSQPKNVICTVHTTSCYEQNRHTSIVTISSSNNLTLIKDQHGKFTTDINTLTPNIPHQSFLTSHIVLKILTHKASSAVMYDPITQMYTFCPLTETFNVDESRPLIVPHEFQQPVEISILEFIDNTKYNHKLYNLIQNTLYELSPSTEEHKIIKALELLWPLLQTKYNIRLIAKLLTSSEIMHDVFPHGFFTDE